MLPNLFSARRHNFLRFFELAELRSSSEDQRIELAIRFVLAKQKSKVQTIKTADFVYVTQTREDDIVDNLGWISDKWWSCVTGGSASTKRDVPESLNRKMFEICICTCVMQELKSGDLFVSGGEKFGDWRKELVSSEEYKKSIKKYCKRVGLPTNPNAIVDKVRQQLIDATRTADDNLPNNQHLDFDGKHLYLKRLRKQPQPNDFAKVEREIAKNMPLMNIPQILVDTDRWIGWTRYFKPLSGFKGKIMSPRARYIGTTFCYGCNLGPTQAARSLEGFDRKQIAWVDKRHVADEDLQNAITLAVNEYKKFDLPKKWGDGSSASADGTQWDIY